MTKSILITLTASESKRLIAKAIARLPAVQEAYRTGIVSLQLSSSNAYVYEELSAKSINKSNHICGYIHEAGGCAAYLPAINKREVYFEKGVEKYLNFPLGDFHALYQRMTKNDILIKSGNILANNNKAAVFVGEPSRSGGEWGLAYPYVREGKFSLIVPMTLNKSLHVDVEDIIAATVMDNIVIDKTHVMADILPLPGLVITELEAFQALSGADAKPVAASGVGSGEGTVTFLLQGTEDVLTKAWDLIVAIKGEPRLEVTPRCGECLAIKNHGICRAQNKIYK